MAHTYLTVNQIQNHYSLPFPFRFSIFARYLKNRYMKVRAPGSIVRYSEQCYNSVVFDVFNPLLLAIARVAISPSDGSDIDPHAFVGLFLTMPPDCLIFCGICRTSINHKLMLHLPWRMAIALSISPMLTRCLPRGRRWLREARLRTWFHSQSRSQRR